MDQPLFRQEAIEQQGERLWGDIILTQPISFYLISSFLLLSTVAGVLFLSFNDYQRKQDVKGFLTPENGVVAVYASQPGLLAEMRVEEGDRVRAGQDLLRIQVDQRALPDAFMAERILEEIEVQENTLLKQVALEQRLLTSNLRRHDEQLERLASEVAQLQDLLTTQRQLEQLALQSYERSRSLLARGSLSHADLDSVQTRYLERRQTLQTVQMDLSNRRFELEEMRIQREALEINSLRAISEIENSLAELGKQKARAQGERFNLVKSPVDGRVSTLLPRLGQRVGLERPLFSVVPENSRLEAQVYVPTRAIGFLEVGQSVNMRYEAFPYQRFGLYSGTIKQISKTVLTPQELPAAAPLSEPAYKVTVSLDRQTVSAYGEEVMLKPGMLMSADVILDRRSLFEWLFEPLYSLRGKL